jgi:hypothetical protein
VPAGGFVTGGYSIQVERDGAADPAEARPGTAAPGRHVETGHLDPNRRDWNAPDIADGMVGHPGPGVAT